MTPNDPWWHAGRLASGMAYDAAARPRAATQDCTRFAFAWLRAVYGPVVDAEKSRLHIADAARWGPWSNIFAMVALGLGHEVAEPTTPGRFYYVQGWTQTEPLRGPGHASIFWMPPAMSADSPRVLQATPGDGPWFTERTWPEHRARWPEVRLVLLKEA